MSAESVVVDHADEEFDRLASVLPSNVRLAVFGDRLSSHFVRVFDCYRGHVRKVDDYHRSKHRSIAQLRSAVHIYAQQLIGEDRYTTVGTRENKKAGLNTYAFSWTGISLSLYERVARAARWDRVSFLAAPSGVDISSENQCEKRTTLRTDESAGGEQ